MEIIISVFLPIIIGIIMLLWKEPKKRRDLIMVTGTLMAVSIATPIYTILSYHGNGVSLFNLSDSISIFFKPDGLGRIFAAAVIIVWFMAGIFSFEYMRHEHKEKRYYGFFFISLGVLLGLCFAGNLVTYYAFFEMLTIMTMPLVIHNQSHEAVIAALKYMFYSFAGAYMVIFGLYVLFKNTITLNFIPGGVLDVDAIVQNRSLLLIAAMLIIVGFGVKAGMFPMHAWLPTAHPVAPAPASAFLSAIIVKAGVLGIIRAIYYVFGAGILRGSWVQYTWLILSLITVFMGSMLAYREKVFKKRLAYSTVSQVSYILFGLAIMNETAFVGSILHVIAHAFIKSTLFLVAGAFIFKTGKTNVDDYKGIGKKMPVTLWCYTFASLGLIGIPPTSGFVSKWFLATGALDSGLRVFAYLGPAILLVSALLTAGYLLPITMRGFYPGEEYLAENKNIKINQTSVYMLVPLIVLTVLSVIIGMMPNVLIDIIGSIAQVLF